MVRRLRLRRFKGFLDAQLTLGGLTVVVGTNASGKSNLRDAFRFLHGVSRGYTLAEVIGEKWGEGGVLQWRGIRGGTREAAFQGGATFQMDVDVEVRSRDRAREASYQIEVHVGDPHRAARVISERLFVQGFSSPVLLSLEPTPADLSHLAAEVRQSKRGRNPTFSFLSEQPLLSQLAEDTRVEAQNRELARATLRAFSDMRFLDLSPEAMRHPSLPGQIVLGDRGENLSSVLQALCEEPLRKKALLEWVRELTPMDAADFEFEPDATGRLVLKLIEEGGRSTTASSASDGTLRFLAMIAALLGPHPASFYFFEELESGIHPARIHLLLELIEGQLGRGGLQVVGTTHSPQLLAMLSPGSLKHASLTYRLSGRQDAHIVPILDLPEARRVLQEQDVARLYTAGWLEDAVAFAQAEEVGA